MCVGSLDVGLGPTFHAPRETSGAVSSSKQQQTEANHGSVWKSCGDNGLPERFGLFTLILLGESVVAVMHGMESQEDWTPAAATSAFLGMAIAFVIWWWYFDGAAGAAEQPVRTKREALRFHIWSYAHFPLYLGILVVGVGVQRIVTAASRTTLTIPEATILTSAMTLVMLALTAIGITSGGRRLNSSRASISIALAMMTALLGAVASTLASPVVLIILIAAMSVLQLSVALPNTLSPAPVAGHRRNYTSAAL